MFSISGFAQRNKVQTSPPFTSDGLTSGPSGPHTFRPPSTSSPWQLHCRRSPAPLRRSTSTSPIVLQGMREVPVSEIKNIVAVMQEGSGDRRLRATIAVTNILPDSQANRQNAMTAGTPRALPIVVEPTRLLTRSCAGLLSALVIMLGGNQEDKRLSRLAVACLSNLSAEAGLKVICCKTSIAPPPSTQTARVQKRSIISRSAACTERHWQHVLDHYSALHFFIQCQDAIARAGVIPLVSRHLEPAGSKEGRAASAHAAATLWSLCIDSPHIKRMMASSGSTLSRLVQLLLSRHDPFHHAHRVGCLQSVLPLERHVLAMLVVCGYSLIATSLTLCSLRFDDI